MNTKFTILHSNDMHGDFLAELKAGETKLIGGLVLLSGYINKVARERKMSSICPSLKMLRYFTTEINDG